MQSAGKSVESHWKRGKRKAEWESSTGREQHQDDKNQSYGSGNSGNGTPGSSTATPMTRKSAKVAMAIVTRPTGPKPAARTTTNGRTANPGKAILALHGRARVIQSPSTAGIRALVAARKWRWGDSAGCTPSLTPFSQLVIEFSTHFLCPCVMDCRSTGSRLFRGAICRPPRVARAQQSYRPKPCRADVVRACRWLRSLRNHLR